MSTGAERIAAERQRQMDVEGWTPEHDAAHTGGSDPHEPHHHWAYENYKGQWFVIRGDGTQGDDHLAVFEPFHPNPEQAARAEVRRLNAIDAATTEPRR